MFLLKTIGIYTGIALVVYLLWRWLYEV